MKTNLPTPVRILLGLTLSALGGLAFVLAFPPYEIWPLAFLGFVPVLLAQYRIMPPKLSALASSVGVAVWLQGYLGPVFAPIGTFMRWLPLIAFGVNLLTDARQRAFNNKTGYRWFMERVTGRRAASGHARMDAVPFHRSIGQFDVSSFSSEVKGI